MNREIEVAIVLLEDALELARYGATVVYDFSDYYKSYCFTGLTTSHLLDEKVSPATIH